MNSSISTETVVDENVPANSQENGDLRKSCSNNLRYESLRLTQPEEFEVVDEARSSDEGSMHVLNDFSDAECGEPMVSQHLRLDFTPVEGVDDNPALQEKCSDFWQSIYKDPKLSGFMVYPDKGYEEAVDESSSITCLGRWEKIQSPAVNWLKTGVGQETSFVVKQQSKYCNDRDGDYDCGPTGDARTSAHRLKAVDKKKSGGVTPTLSNIPLRGESKLSRIDKTISSPSAKAAELCSQLEEWDQKHPKCMDPPGRVPPLTRAIMQRKVQER